MTLLLVFCTFLHRGSKKSLLYCVDGSNLGRLLFGTITEQEYSEYTVYMFFSDQFCVINIGHA